MKFDVKNNSSVHVAHKQNCIGCGKELGVMSQHQLADMTAICKDCRNKTIPYFEPSLVVEEDYHNHLKQLEDGQKLYDAYFEKNKKLKKAGASKILYDPVTALVCITGKRGGMAGFGGTPFYCVMRLADLDLYEKATKFSKGLENKNVADDHLYMTFRNTNGLSAFMIPASEGTIKEVKKMFDEAFHGKGLIARTKAGFKKNQDQAMAAAGLAQGLKKAMSGDGFKTGEADDAMREGAAQMAANMDQLFYAGREDMIQKADAAIKAVLG